MHRGVDPEDPSSARGQGVQGAPPPSLTPRDPPAPPSAAAAAARGLLGALPVLGLPDLAEIPGEAETLALEEEEEGGIFDPREVALGGALAVLEGVRLGGPGEGFGGPTLPEDPTDILEMVALPLRMVLEEAGIHQVGFPSASECQITVKDMEKSPTPTSRLPPPPQPTFYL